MSSNYHYQSQYKSQSYAERTSYDPTTLQPLLSSIAQFCLLFVLIYFLTFGNSVKNLKELFQMAFNSILSGKAFGKGTIDWNSPQDLSSVDAKGKGSNGIRRRYVDTQQGKEAWESGSESTLSNSLSPCSRVDDERGLPRYRLALSWFAQRRGKPVLPECYSPGKPSSLALRMFDYSPNSSS
jgi:hypothetical protein